MTSYTDADIRLAYENGAAIAKSYKPGEKFLGAWGECDLLGYAPNSMQRSIFTVAYCANLKRPIITTADGIITQYGPVS